MASAAALLDPLAHTQGKPSPEAEATTITIKEGHSFRFVTEVEGDLWACDLFGGCYRVDTSTSPATLIPQGAKGGFTVALGFGSAWLSKTHVLQRTPAADEGLFRFDLKTNQEVAKIPVGSVVGGVFIADGVVWVPGTCPNSESYCLYRVNPATNQVTAKIPLQKSKKSEVAQDMVGPFIGAAMGSVWVLYTDGTLSRIDPETNKPLAEIRVGPPHRGRFFDFSIDSYSGLAIGEGSVWITESKSEGNLIRVDLKTNKVVATIPVGYLPQRPVVGGGFVYLTTYYSDSAGHHIVKVDPRTNKVLGFMFLRGSYPIGLSAQKSGILAWAEEVTRWRKPKRTFIWKIPY